MALEAEFYLLIWFVQSVSSRSVVNGLGDSYGSTAANGTGLRIDEACALTSGSLVKIHCCDGPADIEATMNSSFSIASSLQFGGDISGMTIARSSGLMVIEDNSAQGIRRPTIVSGRG